MDAIKFFTFVAAALTAFGFLALILEFLNPERYLAQETREEARRPSEGLAIAKPASAALPAFFGKLHVNDLPATSVGFDDGLLALLQHHVKAEQEMVHEFVHFPSIDSLYRQSGSMLRAH